MSSKMKTHFQTTFICESKLKWLQYDENVIIGRGYKADVKQGIRKAAFKDLLTTQQMHNKVKVCSLMTTLVCLQHWIHTLWGLRCNLLNLYKPNIYCPLKSWIDGSSPIEDTQEHVLLCTKLETVHNTRVSTTKIVHNNIHGIVNKKITRRTIGSKTWEFLIIYTVIWIFHRNLLIN